MNLETRIKAHSADVTRELGEGVAAIENLPDDTRVTVLVVADARRDFRILLEEPLLR